MKILILCGVIADENQHECLSHARKSLEFSANLFQQKLIHGFKTRFPGDVSVVSAPFVGSWPNASSIVRFRGFSQPQTLCRYVPFLNLCGLRHISRARSVKQALEAFVKLEDDRKLIVVYSAHTPFVEAAAWARQRDPRIRLCLYVPDLPEFMHIASRKNPLYALCKPFDIAAMKRHMQAVDAFVVLTEAMKTRLPIRGKPCLVAEGILTDIPEPVPGPGDETLILYAGKLCARFGIPELLRAFSLLKGSRYRLVLCGTGDCDAEVARAAAKDPRILATGQILPEEVQTWIARASILVNPRPGNQEYTRYSFPSKTIDYLLTGKPVVSYLLEGMPRRYEDFFYPISPQADPAEAIASAILQAAAGDGQEEKYRAFLRYAEGTLAADQIAASILRMTEDRSGGAPWSM